MENFFLFLAEEVREYLAELGFRTLDEAIGHVEMLDVAPAVRHWKAEGLDLAPILAVPELPDRRRLDAGPPTRTTGWSRCWTTS